ncbi:MAG TPA: hypothetical protein VK651_02550, partial [Blastocatellia bacterium]|nr:hypothetical protein [Blastocatellia bacterium]
MRITLILVVASLIAASMPAPLSAFTRQEKLERSQQDEANRPQDRSAQEPAPKPNEEPRKDEPRKPSDPMSAPTFTGLRLRSIGPAFTSGRVCSIAVDPTDHSRYLVGVASGGIWKTTNAGTTWAPVFDNEG